jgi:DNA primase
MRYPPQFVDSVREHFRISEVIGKRIPVKKKGREFMACCPFHHEKTPSFTINDEKGFFHCFGCGMHGDVIGFIKDYEKVSYKEAIERLAGEAGIALPELTQEKREEMDKTTQMVQVMQNAADWFAQQLSAAPNARDARTYLAKRGIRPEIIAKFGMGYAPEGRQVLHNVLLQRNIHPKLQEEIGLIVKRDDGAYQDKYRDRIQFPIHNQRGQVIGFGGRRMKSDLESKAPKYLNSPDTPLFKKSYVLYNMHRARKYASDHNQLIIAEGYMDVIALSQAGFEGAVAPLGTAVTPEQLKLAWSIVNEPIMCLDGDKAGERAMLKSAETALPLLVAGKSLQFCILPEGEDPDSLILARGRGAMEEALKACIPLVEVLWRNHYASKPLATPEQRAGAEKELMETVAKIADEHVREHYKREMKERIKDAGTGRHTQEKIPPSYTQGMMKSGKGKKNTITIKPTKLPDSLDVKSQMLRCHEQILALIYHVPSLLANGDVDALVSQMEVSGDHVLEALRAACSLASAEAHAQQAKPLDEFIASPSMRQQVKDRVAISKHLNLYALAKEKEPQTREKMAVLLFEQMRERLAQIHIGQEHVAAALHMSFEGTGASLKRFYEVSKKAKRPHEDAGWYGTDE